MESWMPLRAEEFPFPFPADQRALAQRFIDNRQVTLLDAGEGGTWRAGVRIFKRGIPARGERDTLTGALSCDRECPHVENTGEGCAHLFALVLASAKHAAGPAAPDAADDDTP